PFGESSRVGLFTADAADDDGELVRVGRQSRRRSRLGLLSLLFGGDRFVRRDWNVLRAGGAGGQRQQNSCYDQIADHDLSQSFTFAQEPFAASQSDQQDEIDRHIPEVFAHAFGVFAFEQCDLIEQIARGAQGEIFSAGLGRGAFEQLDVLSGVIKFARAIGDQKARLRRAERCPASTRGHLYFVQPVLVGRES